MHKHFKKVCTVSSRIETAVHCWRWWWY